jgi:hypothetical protein
MGDAKDSSPSTSKSESDEVHVDLSNGRAEERKGRGAAALLNDVPESRQITITWKKVNVHVPIFKVKKSVLKDPKQLIPSFGRKKNEDRRQVRATFCGHVARASLKVHHALVSYE